MVGAKWLGQKAHPHRRRFTKPNQPNQTRTQPELHIEKPHAFSDGTHELIAKNNKICVPKSLQHKCAKWCHLTSMHTGKQRLELTTAQHCTWIGLKPTCVRVCKNCENCAASEERNQKAGLLPPEPTPEIIPVGRCVHLQQQHP